MRLNRSRILPEAHFALRGLPARGSATPMHSTGPGRSDGGGAARGRAAARRLRRRRARAARARGLPVWSAIPKPRARSSPTTPARAPASRASTAAAAGSRQIDRSRIVTDTPVEVDLRGHLPLQRHQPGCGRACPCSGASTRWFTFDREGDGQLSLAEMADTRALNRHHRGGVARPGAGGGAGRR